MFDNILWINRRLRMAPTGERSGGCQGSLLGLKTKEKLELTSAQFYCNANENHCAG